MRLRDRLYDKIDGVTYDTKRAKFLGRAQYGEGAQYAEFRLYQADGAYFAHVYGASGTKYAVPGDGGALQPSERLVPVGADEARELLALIAGNTPARDDVGGAAGLARQPHGIAAPDERPAVKPALPEAVAELKRSGYSLTDIAKAYFDA